MTDETLRIDQPAQVVSAIGKLLSQGAVDWWETNSSAVRGDIETLTRAAGRTAKALAEGRISAETAQSAFEAQREVLAGTPAFIEFMAAAGAQSLFDGVFDILGGAIEKVAGINPFALFGGG